MTYEDLPSDWPARSLADPALAADVVDLVVSDLDRSSGGLSFLLCRPGGTLSQPVFVETQGCPDRADVVRQMTDGLREVPEVRGLVLAVAKQFGGLDDDDRRVHDAALQVCRELGLTLHGTYLATHAGVRLLPVAVELTSHRPGAA